LGHEILQRIVAFIPFGAPMKNHIVHTTIALVALATMSIDVALAQTTVIGQGSTGVVTVVPIGPGLGAPGQRNSLGWNTGYTAITTTSERPNILGRGLGGSDTIAETVTRVVPNDALGNPSRFGGVFAEQPNSAGWRTGYSAITSTYERPDPLGAYLGGSRTVTETKTQVLPNDALGQPIRPFGGLWP
jgi:hypothetical protein